MNFYNHNYITIIDLVKNHFGLSEDSFEYFKEKTFKGTSCEDEKVLSILDENYRYEITIPEEQLEIVDDSWKLFKFLFNEYVEENNIKYKDFRLMKVKRQKNELKISKDIIRYYKSKRTIFLNVMTEGNALDIEDSVLTSLDGVNNLRLPLSNDIKFVLTFNISDMFLSSTGQNWTSCLNLNSTYHGCYWIGLAAIPFDPNKGMVYLSAGSEDKKVLFNQGEYVLYGDKFFRRSFVSLDNINNLNIIKWYPNNFLTDEYKKVLNNSEFYFKDIDENFNAKKEIDIIPKIKDIEFFLYQDKTRIVKRNNKNIILYSSAKSNQHFIFGKELSGPFIGKEGGLTDLILRNESADYYLNLSKLCHNCGVSIESGQEFQEDSRFYCNDCHYQIFEYEEAY